MRKLLGITAAITLLTLAGCGGGADNVSNADQTTSPTDSTESTTSTAPTETTETTDSQASGDYCAELKRAKANFSNLGSGQINEKTYQQLVDELHKVSTLAPSDVQDDWESITDLLTQLHDILASAGISFDDLQTMSAGQIPPGVNVQKLQKIGPKIQKISGKVSTSASSKAIQKSVQSECGFSLN